MNNPLGKSYNEDEDHSLVTASVKGNRQALNKLLEKHNSFIFNITIKLLGDVERARDVTQDILIKITTNLAKYDPEKASFRAWLYRLAFNHALDEKKSAAENRIVSFSQFFDFIDDIPDQVSAESDIDSPYTRETKIKCTTGMLMCLSREQRLIFIVGELFQTDHTLGAEIFNISKANFRKRLSRIRQELYQWMNNRCGLVNKDNPCRCSKKTKGFIERGIVNPEKLLWDENFQNQIKDFSESRLEELQVSIDQAYSKLYREHPMKNPVSVDEVMSTVLGDQNLQEIIDL